MEPSADTHGGSQDTSAHRRRTLRALILASLIVCVLLVGAGSFMAKAVAGRANIDIASVLNGGAQQPSARLNDTADAAHAHSGPDIIPTCNCQSSQVTQYNATISGQGREIVVSTSKQELYAYDNGQLAFNFDVVTGRPELPTPLGHWTVMLKATDITFYSPWPAGSAFYYYPTHINYALLFHDGGFYLHDAWWRKTFGPGSNVYHINSDGSGETGSHGCVGMTLDNAGKLYAWTPVGTSVLVTT